MVIKVQAKLPIIRSMVIDALQDYLGFAENNSPVRIVNIDNIHEINGIKYLNVIMEVDLDDSCAEYFGEGIA